MTTELVPEVVEMWISAYSKAAVAIDWGEPGGEYTAWAVKTNAAWQERGKCPYCGGNSERVNLRGGRECPGCGAPK